MTAYDKYNYYKLTTSDNKLLKTFSVRIHWDVSYVLLEGNKTFKDLITQDVTGYLPVVCFGEWLEGPVIPTFSNTGKSRKYSEIDLFRFKREHFIYDMNILIVEEEKIMNSSDRTLLYSKMP